MPGWDECWCLIRGFMLGSESEEQWSCGQAGDSASPALIFVLDCIFVLFGRAWSRTQALCRIPEDCRLYLPVVLTQWVISSFTL